MPREEQERISLKAIMMIQVYDTLESLNTKKGISSPPAEHWQIPGYLSYQMEYHYIPYK